MIKPLYQCELVVSVANTVTVFQIPVTGKVFDISENCPVTYFCEELGIGRL